MSYAITSDRGKNIAAGLNVGGTYTASDGSTWTKQADGSVSVTHNGVTTQNAYTPSSGTGAGVSYAAAAKNGGAGYSLGTQAGADAYNSVLQTGKSVQLSDGTILVKGSDGKVYAERNGGGVLNADVTYGNNDDLVSSLTSMYAPGENNVYSQAQAQLEKANALAVQKAAQDLEQQKTDTNLSYSQLFRQLYLNRMNAEKNLGQQMAAQGINGGASETSRLGLSTSYAEALRQGEQERLNTLSDLDKAITDTRLTGDISIAESAAENAINSANSYASVLQSLLKRNDTLSDTSATNARDLAEGMLNEGNMPSAALLAAAGISQADAASIVQSVKNQTAKSEAYTLAMEMLRAGELPDDATLATADISKDVAAILQKIYTPQPVQQDVNEDQVTAWAWAALNGDTSESVRSKLEAYYGMPFDSVLRALRFAYAM